MDGRNVFSGFYKILLMVEKCTKGMLLKRTKSFTEKVSRNYFVRRIKLRKKLHTYVIVPKIVFKFLYEFSQQRDIKMQKYIKYPVICYKIQWMKQTCLGFILLFSFVKI